MCTPKGALKAGIDDSALDPMLFGVFGGGGDGRHYRATPGDGSIYVYVHPAEQRIHVSFSGSGGYAIPFANLKRTG